MTDASTTKDYYIVPPCPREPEVIYEDDYFLIVNKPEFLLTVPGRAPENKDCLITRLQQVYPTAKIVHRLDLDTSGLIIIPLTKEAQSHISRQFQERTITKHYIAEVYGQLPKEYGEINLPLSADWPNRPLQRIHLNGKASTTQYETIDKKPERTRLLLKPITGRSHQLRIHMSAIGHPIIGCDMYAHPKAYKMSKRLLLHATSISFQHPATDKIVSFEKTPDF